LNNLLQGLASSPDRDVYVSTSSSPDDSTAGIFLCWLGTAVPAACGCSFNASVVKQRERLEQPLSAPKVAAPNIVPMQYEDTDPNAA
jgi:hypothetical protein